MIKWIHPNLFKASPPDPTRAFLQPLSLSSTPCSLLFSRHGGSSFKDAHDRGGGSHWKQQLMIMMMMPPASLQGRMHGGVPLPAQPPPPPPPAGTPPSPCLERRSQIQSLASSSSNSKRRQALALLPGKVAKPTPSKPRLALPCCTAPSLHHSWLPALVAGGKDATLHLSPACTLNRIFLKRHAH